MKSVAVWHPVKRAAGCMLFFGLVAPPLGGMVMFLLMVSGASGPVAPERPGASDMLNMMAFTGAFSYVFGFLPACLVGAIAGIAHPGISRLRWFLLLCAALSATAPGMLDAGQKMLGAAAILPGMLTGFLWWRRGMRDVPHDDVSPGQHPPDVE